ncbi:MAG: FmdB family zinc ribbon protein [Candidatus Electrothrix sp. YB6]
MPIYEYVCKDCTKRFEVLTTSSGSAEPVRCPACQSSDVRKEMSSSCLRVGSGGLPSGCPSKSGFS